MAEFNYAGNPDFRGYLNANDATKWLLDYVGNDGKFGGTGTNGMFYDKNINTYGMGGKYYNSYVTDSDYGARSAYSVNEMKALTNKLYNQFVNAKGGYDQSQAMAQLAASLRTPTPRFINYDIGGSWNKARQMATEAVSPVYQQKMTDFVNRQKVELERQQTDTTTGKSALDQALERLMGDTQVQRGRTAEDTTTNITDITDAQKYASRAEGLNFDVANRALNEDVNAAGLSESGLGQQQVQEAQLARREGSNESVRQFENKVEAQNTLMNRTFEDLTTKEQRGSEDTTSAKSKLDLDLERFIEDQAFDLDQEGKTNELSKQADIAQKSIGLQGQLVDQWIASLSGQGYTAQEIANAASIYK